MIEPVETLDPGLELALWRRFVADRRIRYLVVGGISAVVYYGLFSGLWLASGRHLPYLAAATIANALTCVICYPLYRRNVFQVTGPWLAGLVRFYVVSLWALACSLIGLPLLIEFGGVPVLLAQAIIVVAVPLINYQVNKRWTFKSKQTANVD